MSTNRMIHKAARALCKRASEACSIDCEDNWKVYSEDYIADATAALEACGAPDLLEALLRCRFDSLNMSLADLEFCKAAYAKATRSAA